mmetsp:Transcript_44756/g.133720  ORF Transcript_44756/g.133720 Transcript_44756/m.133720 type:complete len:281 (-) Transcript_44756:128-970(-)
MAFAGEVTLAAPLSSPSISHSQRLQQALAERDSGAPREQIRSAATRLRKTRSCGFMHSSMEEPLHSYKALEPTRPHCMSTFRRFHLTEGFRVLDQDTIVVPARDTLLRTKTGLMRSSSGTVTYSHAHKLKLELDVEVLAKILLDGAPGGGHMWTPFRLERMFKERTGRAGCWVDYDIGMKSFLALFPKTFELFGPTGEFVQLRRKVPAVLDDAEDAIIRLARARQTGVLEPYVDADGGGAEKVTGLILPKLTTNRFKAVYCSHAVPSKTPSTLPASPGLP